MHLSVGFLDMSINRRPPIHTPQVTVVARGNSVCVIFSQIDIKNPPKKRYNTVLWYIFFVILSLTLVMSKKVKNIHSRSKSIPIKMGISIWYHEEVCIKIHTQRLYCLTLLTAHSRLKNGSVHIFVLYF